jgi:hypothetical protein
VVAAALFGFGRRADEDEVVTDVDLTKAQEEVAATKAAGKLS